MNAKGIVGIVLILIGLVALTVGGFSFMKRDKVLDVGSVEVTQQKRETIPISPIVGLTALGGGVILLLTASDRRRRIA